MRVHYMILTGIVGIKLLSVIIPHRATSAMRWTPAACVRVRLKCSYWPWLGLTLTVCVRPKSETKAITRVRLVLIFSN